MHHFVAHVKSENFSGSVTVTGFRSKENAQAFLDKVERGLEEAVENNQITRFETTDVIHSDAGNLYAAEPTDVDDCVDYLIRSAN